MYNLWLVSCSFLLSRRLLSNIYCLAALWNRDNQFIGNQFKAISKKELGIHIWLFKFLLWDLKTLFGKWLMCYQSGPVACTELVASKLAVKVASCDKAIRSAVTWYCISDSWTETQWSPKLLKNGAQPVMSSGPNFIELLLKQKKRLTPVC